jgi:hypothetical protein
MVTSPRHGPGADKDKDVLAAEMAGGVAIAVTTARSTLGSTLDFLRLMKAHPILGMLFACAVCLVRRPTLLPPS